MMAENISEDFIMGLQKTGLTYEEAMIYFVLIQQGQNGTYVRDLETRLNIKRTTIYSILNRLVSKGCVVETKKSETPKKAKSFVATRPAEFITATLQNKLREIEELKVMQEQLAQRLEDIYENVTGYGLNDLDAFLRPYISPLLDHGWQVIQQEVEKDLTYTGFEVYDCVLIVPKAQFIKDCGFLVLRFDRVIENDQVAINYAYDLMKRKGREEILKKNIGVTDLRMSDATITLFEKTFLSIKMEFLFNKSRTFQEFTKSVIMPIKDKIFYIWAENYDILSEIVEIVFNVEEI